MIPANPLRPALDEALRSLVSDPALRTQLGPAARARARRALRDGGSVPARPRRLYGGGARARPGHPAESTAALP